MQAIEAQIIKVSDINADEQFNCRGPIKPLDVADLAKDIELHGLLQPVLVCRHTEEEESKYGKKFKLIAGFRRFKAHQVLEWDEISCVVKDHLDESTARVMNLAENLKRKDLTILQEARAIKKLHDYGVNEQEVADRLGKSRGWVQIRFMLLKLPEDVQAEVEAGIINQTNIRELYTILGYGSIDRLYEAVKTIKEKKAKGLKGISVDPNRTSPKAKHHRSRSEIFEMMEHIQETEIGNGLWTQCMSWCAGELSDVELYQALKVHALKHEITYTMPQVSSVI